MLPRSGLLNLVEKEGSLAEKQLVGRWRAGIEAFLAAFAEGIRKGEQRLEIGLESALVLKLIVKRAALPPAAGLMRIAPTLPPPLAALAGHFIQEGLQFHVGLRVQADACHREIYVYERDDIVRQALAAQGVSLPPPPPEMTVSFYGIDELAGVSAYFTDPQNPLVREHAVPLGNRLSEELKFRIEEHISGIWEHMRLRDGAWRSSKFGFELKDVPVELATRVISHYRPPHFRYLVPFRPYHGIVIAASIDTGVAGWYFNL